MTQEDLLKGFCPLGNYFVFVRKKAEEMTKSGLFIPTVAQDPVVYGEVTHIGTGQKNGLNGNSIPMQLQVGDKVVVHPSGIQSVKIEGVEIEVVHEGDCIGFWRVV